MENLRYIKFNEVNFDDPFFDSLKSDYSHGFLGWIRKKSESNVDYAYVLYDENNHIDGFMYLKIESEPVTDVFPPLPNKKHLKVGTFKFNPKGTLRGQRFLKKIFDHAIIDKVDDIYVTVFNKHRYLIKLFQMYGFIIKGEKTSANGTEHVLVRDFTKHDLTGDFLSDYPYINMKNGQSVHLLSIHPEYHTKLFPDSKLVTESPDIIKDISHANSIRKIYICGMKDVMHMRPGDVIVIYRTSDNQGPAHYRSVATSLCVVEEVRHIETFATEQEFIDYSVRYSVFTESELKGFYFHKKYPYIISFSYNVALPKRLTREKLINNIGLNQRAYWGVMSLSKHEFESIIKLSEVDESIIVN